MFQAKDIYKIWYFIIVITNRLHEFILGQPKGFVNDQVIFLSCFLLNLRMPWVDQPLVPGVSKSMYHTDLLNTITWDQHSVTIVGLFFTGSFDKGCSVQVCAKKERELIKERKIFMDCFHSILTHHW